MHMPLQGGKPLTATKIYDAWGDRIKQPDIMHLIRLIEQIEAEKKRKRLKEMSLGTRI